MRAQASSSFGELPLIRLLTAFAATFPPRGEGSKLCPAKFGEAYTKHIFTDRDGAYFWMAFIRPPAEMMFWIKGGKGSAWNTLPLVSSVMTPVSKST